MFKKRAAINVLQGDIFHEPLKGAGKIFRQLNINDAPSDQLVKVWTVADLLNFNDLPHARLHCPETGEMRIISISILKEQKTYLKIQAETPES